MDCPDFGMCNPSVIQPNVRRQATLNRDTESVVALTPNIELVVRPWSLVKTSDRRTAKTNGQRLTTNGGFSGGADRDRTGGLLVANQALSQLSYSPTIKWWAWVELNYRPHPYQGCALAN
jgi:hypothetical protein